MTKTPFLISCNSFFARFMFLILLFFSVNQIVNAQDKAPVTFGKVSLTDFELPKSKIIDSNTNAVIIADVGSISFIGSKTGWFIYVYKRKRRVKILNKKAIELATVKIPLYTTGLNSEMRQETLNDITASTYNLENGKVTETALSKNDIFEDHIDKHHTEKKITMPAVKAGSIIEYSYTINSEFTFNLPEWEFQTNDYPCLWSELNVEIPALLGYAIKKQGYDSLYINKYSQGAKNYHLTNKVGSSSSYGQGSEDLMVSVNTFMKRWVMKDVPPLQVSTNERYISSSKNYIDKIEFQLLQVYEGEGGQEKNEIVKNWRTASAELLNEYGFGSVINVDFSWAENKLADITGNTIDKLERAKKIYYYIKDNFSCTNHHNFYASKSLIDVFNAKSGNVGEINLLLLSLLRQNQISAEPVLISTRQNGYSASSFANSDKFDYVVCKAILNGEVFYLDASNPLLGFGKLPGYCYNGYGHVINQAHPDSVDFFPGSLKEPNTINVFIVNDDTKPGAITGGFELNPNEFESYNIRMEVNEKGQKKFFETLQEKLGQNIEIENTGIDSIALMEYPVKLHYDFTQKNKGGDIIYFNPLINWYTENPFKNEERKFPVEMPYKIDDMYTLSMEIPNGYIIDEMPKSSAVALNGTDGFFEYSIQKSETNILLRTHIKLNKTFFLPDSYNSLREFFSYIIKKQSEQVVFKKKK
jgi:uncharacterized protein DUF3857/transglutaminase superfamily protein/uncharacterized protein DUF3858